MRRPSIPSLLTLVLALPTAAVAQPARPIAQHVPLHAAHAGTIELRFQVAEPDRVRGVIVRCTPRGVGKGKKPRVLSAQARRSATGYVANAPAACAQPPGFRYWAVLVGAQGEEPLFASPEAPHEVRVTLPRERELELTALRAHAYKRSRVMLAAEGVSFGDQQRVADGPVVHDRYYRLETGYGYSFFAFIEDIALTLVRVRAEGATPEPELQPEPSAEVREPGVDYGRASVTLRITDFVRTRSSLLLGASQDGFESGFSGELVLGDPMSEHLLLGGETLSTLGTTGFLGLGFNATSSIPMGARVEVTDFPLGRDAAVRLLYEIGYRFTPVTELRLRGGYQGRTSVGGGLSLGAAFQYGF